MTFAEREYHASPSGSCSYSSHVMPFLLPLSNKILRPLIPQKDISNYSSLLSSLLSLMTNVFVTHILALKI